MAQSIKERTFYAIEDNDKLLGVWDNPSLAERELRSLAKEIVAAFKLYMKENREDKHTLRINFTDILNQPWDRVLSMKPIKMNVRLA